MTKFSVQMFKDIERDINEFVTDNSIETTLNVKHSLLNVIDRIHNTPKFLDDVRNDSDLQTKTTLVAKKYISEIANTNLDVSHNSQEIPKVIILDSKKTTQNNDWYTFSFDEDLETKNLNLECIIIKSKNIIDANHVHIRCKQMPRSTIFNDKHISDYHTSLILTRVVSLDNTYYYHYKPITNKGHTSNIRLVFSKLDIDILDHKHQSITFKERIPDLKWNVIHDKNQIEIVSDTQKIRQYKHFHTIDSNQNVYDLSLMSHDDDDRVTLQSDHSFPEILNELHMETNEFTLFFTYN